MWIICYCNSKVSMHNYQNFHYINVLLVIINYVQLAGGMRKGMLMVPASYIAQSNDLDIQLRVQLEKSNFTDIQNLKLQITRILTSGKVSPTFVDIDIDVNHNVTQIKIPCYHFLFGGAYELKIIGDESNKDERLQHILNVTWPAPKLKFSLNSISTYPETKVQGILQFLDVQCVIPEKYHNTYDLPELWLELYYCGKSDKCSLKTIQKSQMLLSEQVRGLPKLRMIDFNCNLFGLAGYYLLVLKSAFDDPLQSNFTEETALLKADWNKQYVFTVHTRSIFPCDPHGSGVRVLFQYPSCIINQADRIRVYAKLRADVLSLVPPTSLHYIAEQRVIKGQHSLYFGCDLFYEKFIEYCFVYVSQSIYGAVADIRMDCVPTIPIFASDSGGWGQWSNWTHCSTTCKGGTKNRYRFCDSPPPRYGGKFCEGPSIQTEKCSMTLVNQWECLFNPANGNNIIPITTENVNIEIGQACRCGCIIHLGKIKPKRLLGSSSHSCSNRNIWLIQGDESCKIQLTINFHKFSCNGQWLKVWDGDSNYNNLMLQLGIDQITGDNVTQSTKNLLLVEFYSNKYDQYYEDCVAGFLAQAEQKNCASTHTKANESITNTMITPIVQSLNISKLTSIHCGAIVFMCFIVTMSLFLVAQFIFRYRKYELATNLLEADSPAHTILGSGNSLNTPSIHHRSRAVSTITLISEVMSFVKLRSPITNIKHARLGETIECMQKKNEVISGFEKDVVIDKFPQQNMADGPFILNDLDHPNNEVSDNTANETRDDTHRSICKTLQEAQTFSNRKECNQMEENDNKKSEEYHAYTTKYLGKLSPSSNTTLTNLVSSDVDYCSSDGDHNKPIMERPRNIKESKEKRNLHRLLAGSEFSLGNQEDMEMDYYDYNVINAAAAPGSYLGMDPAFLVWIPPLNNEDDISAEIPLEQFCSASEARSNDPTPSKEFLARFTEQRQNDYVIVNCISKNDIFLENDQLYNCPSDNETPPRLTDSVKDVIPSSSSTFSKIGAAKSNDEDEEKETSFTKPHVEVAQINNFCDMTDFQFADDENYEEEVCQNSLRYKSNDIGQEKSAITENSKQSRNFSL